MYNFTVGFLPKRVIEAAAAVAVVATVAILAVAAESFADGEKRDDFGKETVKDGGGATIE